MKTASQPTQAKKKGGKGCPKLKRSSMQVEVSETDAKNIQ